jgi:hypothetical protein
MSITADLDVDALIARLAGPLLPADRVAFRKAAEEAIRSRTVLGRGGRLSNSLRPQCGFRQPPTDTRKDDVEPSRPGDCPTKMRGTSPDRPSPELLYVRSTWLIRF